MDETAKIRFSSYANGYCFLQIVLSRTKGVIQAYR